MEKGLAYDDVLLVPQRSPVESRSEVETSAQVTPNITVDVPIISAPMDTVTEREMAQGMHDAGGVGIIHRFMPITEQASEVEAVEGTVGATVGINGDWEKRAEAVLNAGADFLCLDVAHGHLERALTVVEELATRFPNTDLMAGNVATAQGVVDLVEAGADSVKIGIGPGSHCLTREVAGVGVPQLTAIQRAMDGVQQLTAAEDGPDREDITIVADGGIRKSGDIVKALMAGADTVMIGGLFSGCKESPAPIVEHEGQRYKRTHGMASEEAREENDSVDKGGAVEGASSLTPYVGPVETEVYDLARGLRSGISYCGGYSVEEARTKAEFIRVTQSTNERNGTHGVANSGPDEPR